MTESAPTHYPRLFGIGGHYRSGKDTFAGLLAEHHEPTVVLGFSDPLHDALAALNPYVEPGVRFSDLIASGLSFTEAKAHPEVRALLQRLGTDVGRNIINQNCWVNIAERRIEEAFNEGASVVITGVRFPNELALIKRLGGFTIWVDRNIDRRLAAHPSERSLTSGAFDAVVFNNGTLEDLSHAAADFARYNVS
ncbi:adenylate kinase [Pseudoclavibacter sp. CFCC 13796]|uniref:deoxynucleotide monophosphate kinase family protein n=1 Tax=unclassified Pseudoclavibacter TaxID=2615177 RepID=UPI00130139AF|nr:MULTISPECIES: adenylate kinase [unclassified Pseudoclavibacter]KAB1661540.1 adenylate kinase [Pseudoclavibacter sp. CFCC 13796]MCD7100580.1 hypothetical protein [Pseudoclavibacter sp. 13-3]